MWVKLVWLVAVWRGLAADELLGALAGVHGANRVSLCLRPERGGDARAPLCAGAIWRDRWLLARASCLQGRPLYRVLVLRDCAGYTCQDLDAGWEVRDARKVRAREAAPAGADLALVALDQRAWQQERLANYSTALRLLSPYAQWMEEVYTKYPMDRRRLSYAHKSTLFSSPLRMFMTTILVPSITFIAIFFYVIFFTGSDDQVSYKNIKYEESEASVKCT